MHTKRLLLLALRGHRRRYQKVCGTKARRRAACVGFSQGMRVCRRGAVSLASVFASGFSAAGLSTAGDVSAVPASACDAAAIV